MNIIEITVVLMCLFVSLTHFWQKSQIDQPSIFMSTLNSIPDPFGYEPILPEPNIASSFSMFTITNNSHHTQMLASDCSVKNNTLSVNVTITWLSRQISYTLFNTITFAPICKYYNKLIAKKIAEQPCHCSPFNIICRKCEVFEKETIIKEICKPFQITETLKNIVVQNTTKHLIDRIQQLFSVASIKQLE